MKRWICVVTALLLMAPLLSDVSLWLARRTVPAVCTEVNVE